MITKYIIGKEKSLGRDEVDRFFEIYKENRKREELKVTDMGKKTAAVDIGASSGKMALGVYDGRKLSVEEYRDFPNRPVDIGTALYWIYLRCIIPLWMAWLILRENMETLIRWE